MHSKAGCPRCHYIMDETRLVCRNFVSTPELPFFGKLSTVESCLDGRTRNEVRTSCCSFIVVSAYPTRRPAFWFGGNYARRMKAKYGMMSMSLGRSIVMCGVVNSRDGVVPGAIIMIFDS